MEKKKLPHDLHCLFDGRDDVNVTEVITHIHLYEAGFIPLHHSTQKLRREVTSLTYAL